MPAVPFAVHVTDALVVRIIDMDTTDSAVGSAYGQGSATFDSAALGTADVFGPLSNPWESYYAAGNIVPVGAVAGTAGAIFTGEGDIDEVGTVASASTTGGGYTIASNGYGSMTAITGLGDVTTLGLYATDPTLNLLDPNNTSGVVGSALVLDMTGGPLSGTGVVVPQAATTATDFNGNSYGFGAQDYTARMWDRAMMLESLVVTRFAVQ
jgi:hypothetical protein